MKSSSYSPYIRDHGSRIWSTYGSSIDVFFTIFPMNWRTRRATLANSSASRSHRQPKYMHQNVSICQTSAAICAAIRELNRRGAQAKRVHTCRISSGCECTLYASAPWPGALDQGPSGAAEIPKTAESSIRTYYLERL